MDEWSFPTGTKLWKEMRLGGKRVETRIYWKNGPSAPCDAGMCATWLWTTYRWSKDESSAVRLRDGEPNVDGTPYEIPSETRCAECHDGKTDRILGFEALGLGLAGAQGVTLATLRAEGLLTNPPASDSYALPEDATGKARAALTWLHINCGLACHNAGDTSAASYTGLFLRVRTSQLTGATTVHDLDTWKTAVNQPPRTFPAFAGQGYELIFPGDPSHSLIPKLASSRGVANVPQMPPIVAHTVDDAGVGAVNDWIAAMPDGEI